LQETKVFSSSGDVLADRRYELARAYRGDGDLPAAIELLEQAVELRPDFIAAWFDLGDAREIAGQRDGAIAAFQEALKSDPSDRHGAGLRLRLLDIGGHAMSPDYVRSVFDQYARRFDEALAGLSYNAPQMLADGVARVCEAQQRPVRFANMLDLGCGTGLSGSVFRPAVEFMEGIDLSPGMIEQARRKNIYDQLEVGDLTESLDRHLRNDLRYDLIVAADVFVYCADLTLIAELTAQLLTTDGLFAFTVETHAHDGVILGPKLRYAHGEKHVRDTLASAHLTPYVLAQVSTRMESDQPVPGLLVIAGRALHPPLSEAIG